MGETLAGKRCQTQTAAPNGYCGRCQGHVENVIRKILAGTCTEPELASWSVDRNERIRRAVADAPNLPDTVSVELWQDSGVWQDDGASIRSIIARRHFETLDQLWMICDDVDVEVRSILTEKAYNLSVVDYLLSQERHDDEIIALDWAHNTSRPVFETLAHRLSHSSSNLATLKYIASRTQDQELIDRFIAQDNELIMQGLLSNDAYVTPDTPNMAQAMTHAQLLQIANNPDTSSELLCELISRANLPKAFQADSHQVLDRGLALKLVNAVIRHPNANTNLYRDLCLALGDNIVHCAHEIAEARNAPASVVQQIASMEKRSSVLTHPTIFAFIRRDNLTDQGFLDITTHLSPENLVTALKHRAETVGVTGYVIEALHHNVGQTLRTHIGSLPTTPLPVLKKYAESGYNSVRAAVASNPSIDATLCHELAGDSHYTVKEALAANPGVTHATLERLCKSGTKRVRAVVASNAAVSGAMLDLLSKDRSEEVRAAVAQNASTQSETLTLLSLSRNTGVSAAAAITLRQIRQRAAV